MRHKLLKHFSILNAFICMLLSFGFIFSSCSRNNLQKEEQIRVNNSNVTNDLDTLVNSVQGNLSLNKIATTPNSVLLTGLADHRLVTVYKSRSEPKPNGSSFRFLKKTYEYDGREIGKVEHYMPGFDILYGYNLLNIAHYDLKSEKLSFIFQHSALIKTFYYPSFIQDSVAKKPINRNYYLLSVYDEDTNKDSLINKNDLRRFYYVDAGVSSKIRLIPSEYSVVRSQYDVQNDAMYIFAKLDANKNGTGDPQEPMHIFWINLKSPTVAKRLY